MKAERSIDINCDMGEGSGNEPTATDRELMHLITSANIACGAHAGSPELMESTARLAKQFGVAVGAHPGYADRENFGRREMYLSEDEIYRLVTGQVILLAEICGKDKIDLAHVKPHGALYNQAAKDMNIARAIASAVRDFSREVILVGLAGSRLVEAGQELGLNVANEGFPERAYEPDGSLRSRNLPGALISDPGIAAEQGLKLATDVIQGRNGMIKIDTLCIHGDSPGAINIANALKAKLVDNNIEINRISFK